jgi:hypothetical protein
MLDDYPDRNPDDNPGGRIMSEFSTIFETFCSKSFRMEKKKKKNAEMIIFTVIMWMSK